MPGPTKVIGGAKGFVLSVASLPWLFTPPVRTGTHLRDIFIATGVPAGQVSREPFLTVKAIRARAWVKTAGVLFHTAGGFLLPPGLIPAGTCETH
jgi:hypothetical protein